MCFFIINDKGVDKRKKLSLFYIEVFLYDWNINNIVRVGIVKFEYEMIEMIFFGNNFLVCLFCLLIFCVLFVVLI